MLLLFEGLFIVCYYSKSSLFILKDWYLKMKQLSIIEYFWHFFYYYYQKFYLKPLKRNLPLSSEQGQGNNKQMFVVNLPL